MKVSKTKNGSIHIHANNIHLFLRKVQLKKDKSMAFVINLEKDEANSPMQKMEYQYQKLGSVWLEKGDVETLVFELENIIRSW